MSKVNTILNQLQSKLDMKFGKSNLEQLYGSGFYSHYKNDEESDILDVPFVPDTFYPTYRAFQLPRGKKAGSNYLPFESESSIQEQDEDLGTSDEDLGTSETDVSTDTNLGAGMGNLPYTGLDQEEEKTAGELGRIYELKKIYSRLTSIESYLSNESSNELVDIRGYVSQSIELFEIISSNFNSYKEKLDEIIIVYYKFIKEVYNSVRNFYKRDYNK